VVPNRYRSYADFAAAVMLSIVNSDNKWKSHKGKNMASEFNITSFIPRLGFAAVLVFGSYNPSGYSYNDVED